MANYFFKVSSESFSYDEYTYGVNYATGSSIFTGSSDTWTPLTGSVLVVDGPKVFDSYVFSPKSHGNLADTFYSPPEKFFYSRLNVSRPPITITLATSSYRLSSNRDSNSRIGSRYKDS